MSKLKKWFWIKWGEAQLKKVEPSRENAKFVYLDKMGNKWYAADPQSLHASRGLTAWLLSDDLKYGLTKEKLLTGFKKITEFHNAGKVAEAAKLVGVLEAGLELYSLPEVLLNIATCYTFINDEPQEYKSHYQKMKRDSWDKDPDCRAFFLTFAHQYTSKHNELQASSVLDYFKTVKPILDQLEYRLK